MIIPVRHLKVGNYFKYAGYTWKVRHKEPFCVYCSVDSKYITDFLNPNTLINIKYPRKTKKKIKKYGYTK